MNKIAIYLKTRAGSLGRSVMLLACLGSAVGFVSCSDNDADSAEPKGDSNLPIYFAAGGVTVGAEVRGTVDSTTDLDGEAVVLFGSRYTTTPQWVSGSMIMNGQAATLDATAPNDYDIVYTPQQYYAASDSYYYDFRALYPSAAADGITLTAATAAAAPVVDVDLTYQNDVMIASAAGVQKQATAVDMEFAHQMAQVAFTIKKDATLNPHTLYLQQMGANGNTTGSLNIATGVWSNLADADDMVMLEPVYHGFEVTATAQDAVTAYMLFPITGSATEYYEFAVKVNDRVSTFRLPADGDRWEKGKRYVYNLTVTDANIGLDVSIPQQEQWVDVDNSISII